MIAECSDSRMQSLLPVGGRCSPAANVSAGRGRRCCREWERLPTCQLADLLACRFVGKLAGQGVGRRGCERREGCRWVGGWVGGYPGVREEGGRGRSAAQAQEQAKGFGGSGFTWSMLCAERKNQGWFPLTIAGLLDCRLPNFPGIWEVGKTRGCTHQWKPEEGEAVGDKRGASAGR